MSKKIFVTGGAGFIGSHTCVQLLLKNHQVLVFDDLSNSSEEALRRAADLTDCKLSLVTGDIRNIDILNETMHSFKPDSVIHFAGLKAVGNSVCDPLLYYDVNVNGSINLLSTMAKVGCHEIVFSSSATVYGNMSEPPFTETAPVLPVNPYGRTKLIVENILSDWVDTNDTNRAVVLRYFNPVGADTSGTIGEDPQDIPNNLMPLIAKVAQKKSKYLSIYGSDYDTRDGTGERDYIHVSDLAFGHFQALENLCNLPRFVVLNLGSGKSTTVKELIETFEKTNNVEVPFVEVERRPGDVAKSYAQTALANDLIGFKCKKTLKDMCLDTWNWVQKNPNGYR